MSDPAPKKEPVLHPFAVIMIISVILLAVVFVLLASFGDDVPTRLAPATQTSPGN